MNGMGPRVRRVRLEQHDYFLVSLKAQYTLPPFPRKFVVLTAFTLLQPAWHEPAFLFY